MKHSLDENPKLKKIEITKKERVLILKELTYKKARTETERNRKKKKKKQKKTNRNAQNTNKILTNHHPGNLMKKRKKRIDTKKEKISIEQTL